MMPLGVIQIRQELCSLCADKANDPCAICEHGKWGQYTTVGCDDPNREIETPMNPETPSIRPRPMIAGLTSRLPTAIPCCGKKKQI